MSAVLAAIARHAEVSPAQPALQAHDFQLSYAELPRAMDEAIDAIGEVRPRCLALALESSPVWPVLDLAATTLKLRIVALPACFSPTQYVHALRYWGVDRVVTDRPDLVEALLGDMQGMNGLRCLGVALRAVAGRHCYLLSLGRGTRAQPADGRAKVLCSMGKPWRTTGSLEGVCMSQADLERVALSLASSCRLGPMDRHLSALPLSVRPENISGVYAPLLAGATCCLPTLQEVSLSGATRRDGKHLLDTLIRYGASSVILSPKMLSALVETLEQGVTCPPALRSIAVGAAMVSRRLLQRARALGLPVHQDYGLWKYASGITRNNEGADRLGAWDGRCRGCGWGCPALATSG